TNEMSLKNASPGGLIAAALAFIAVALSLFAAVQVVRSPLKKRWLWVIVALLGFGKISVAWTSGAVTEQWLAVQLFGAGTQRQGLLGPWWIIFSVPGGAFLALDRRRRAIAGQAKVAEASSSEPAAENPA